MRFVKMWPKRIFCTCVRMSTPAEATTASPPPQEAETQPAGETEAETQPAGETEAETQPAGETEAETQPAGETEAETQPEDATADQSAQASDSTRPTTKIIEVSEGLDKSDLDLLSMGQQTLPCNISSFTQA